jgi:hypothetical protein
MKNTETRDSGGPEQHNDENTLNIHTNQTIGERK